MSGRRDRVGMTDDVRTLLAAHAALRRGLVVHAHDGIRLRAPSGDPASEGEST